MKKNKTKQNPPECIVDIVLSFETRQRRLFFRGVVYLLLVMKMILINPNESLFTYVNHRQKPMVIHACAYWLLVTSHYHEGNLTNCVNSYACFYQLHVFITWSLCSYLKKKTKGLSIDIKYLICLVFSARKNILFIRLLMCKKKKRKANYSVPTHHEKFGLENIKHINY